MCSNSGDTAQTALVILRACYFSWLHQVQNIAVGPTHTIGQSVHSQLAPSPYYYIPPPPPPLQCVGRHFFISIADTSSLQPTSIQNCIPLKFNICEIRCYGKKNFSAFTELHTICTNIFYIQFLKCDAGEGWRRLAGPIMWETKMYYFESRNK
jgi:hypothetical protein